MMRNLMFLLMIMGFISCNLISKPPVDYECKEIGWTFSYPGGWEVLSDEDVAILEGRGKEAIENTLDAEVEMNSKNLIWLKKDVFNTFTSTIQPQDSLTAEAYAENQDLMIELIVATYEDKGMEFDYKVGKELIDGLEFATFEVDIYAPGTREVILNQIMFDRLINGNTSLTLSINTNNEKDKESLLEMIKASKIAQ